MCEKWAKICDWKNLTGTFYDIVYDIDTFRQLDLAASYLNWKDFTGKI